VFNVTFKTKFNYIVMVSVIGGGNLSFRKKPPTRCKCKRCIFDN